MSAQPSADVCCMSSVPDSTWGDGWLDGGGSSQGQELGGSCGVDTVGTLSLSSPAHPTGPYRTSVLFLAFKRLP